MKRTASYPFMLFPVFLPKPPSNDDIAHPFSPITPVDSSTSSDNTSSSSSESERDADPSPQKLIEALTSCLQYPSEFENEHQYNLYKKLAEEIGPQLLNCSEWNLEAMNLLREFMLPKYKDGSLKLADPEGFFAAKLRLDLYDSSSSEKSNDVTSSDSASSSSSEPESTFKTSTPKEFIEALTKWPQHPSQFKNEHKYNFCKEMAAELGPQLVKHSEWNQESMRLLTQFLIRKQEDGSLKLADPKGTLTFELGLSSVESASDHISPKKIIGNFFVKQLTLRLQNGSAQFNPLFLHKAKTPQPKRQTSSTPLLKFEKKHNLLFNSDDTSAKAPNYIPNSNLSPSDDSEAECSRRPSSPASDDDIEDLSLNKPSERKIFTPPSNSRKKSPLIKRRGSYPSMKLSAPSPKQASIEASGYDFAYHFSLV
jgi:hypothetical protein